MEVQGLNSNVLKIIALLSMTADHLGMVLFPDVIILRIIGRVSFPIFAFMIAEGCFFTKNRKKYILTILAFGIVCQIVALTAQNSLFMCILVTFTISVAAIFALQNAFGNFGNGSADNSEKQKVNCKWLILAIMIIALSAFVILILPKIAPGSELNTFIEVRNFHFDYGFWGMMLPVFVYIPRMMIKKSCIKLRLFQCLAAAIGLIPLSLTYGAVEWYSFLSLIFLLMYNGQRGKLRLKYLFYVYYPLHLGVIYFIYSLMN